MFVVVWCLALWLVCVMWSELLMTSAISCSSVVISVRVPDSGACIHISGECGIFVMCCMQCCMSRSAVL